MTSGSFWLFSNWPGLEAGQEVLVGDWEKVLAEYQKGKDKMSTIRKMMFILRSSSK